MEQTSHPDFEQIITPDMILLNGQPTKNPICVAFDYGDYHVVCVRRREPIWDVTVISNNWCQWFELPMGEAAGWMTPTEKPAQEWAGVPISSLETVLEYNEKSQP